jgi:uncharacterized protein YkwD
MVIHLKYSIKKNDQSFFKRTERKERKIFELKDLEKLRENEIIESIPSLIGNSSDLLKKLGLECLKLTNEYRKKYSLKVLAWNDGIYEIGFQHSKEMALGKVPFSHQGFNERVNQFPMITNFAAENLAMNYNFSSPAQIAIDGWIKSPGHNKNLLNNKSIYCAISVFKNSKGSYYFTQLFAG